MSHTNAVDLDLIVKKVLDDIGNFAFRCLATNAISVSNSELMSLKEDCRNIFKEYKLPENPSIMTVLSCVLITQTQPNGEFIHQFIHKTHQECFAAEALLNKLIATNTSITTVKTAVSELSQSDDDDIFEKLL